MKPRSGCSGDDLVLVHMYFTQDGRVEACSATPADTSPTPPRRNTRWAWGGRASSLPATAGVNISVGTDITANNSADMFVQLRMLLQVERAREIDKLERDLYFHSRTPVRLPRGAALGHARRRQGAGPGSTGSDRSPRGRPPTSCCCGPTTSRSIGWDKTQSRRRRSSSRRACTTSRPCSSTAAS